MNRYLDDKGDLKGWAALRDTVLFVLALIFAGMAGCPQYNVWEQGLAGEAELKRAEQNRKIKIQEAQATKDSSSLFADAEVERAKGVAQANKIIGASLSNNEAYLRYLWIQTLENGKASNTVVYVPTEANLPILEAQRLAK